MLTKEERAAIAERLDKCEVIGVNTLYSAVIGESVPDITTFDEDTETVFRALIELCDTSNMIELPLDKNGEIIHIGDVVYAGDKELKVSCVKYSDDSSIISVYSDNGCTEYRHDKLTHKKPATIASINEQLRHVLDKGHMSAWSMAQLFDIADQLESLGDKDE